MEPTISKVTSRQELKEFIFLPEKIHAGHANWVPPIYFDEWKFYKSKHNKPLLHSDTILFLARNGKETVGRIMGIINNAYNAAHGESTARFFNLECIDDENVIHALISSVENWSRQKGMKKLTGPFGFSDKDPQGLQVEGFEYLPVLATATNQPYLPILLEGQGFKKETDCVVYHLPVPDEIPQSYTRVYDRLKKNKNIHLVEFGSKRELKPYIVPVFRLVNEAYRSILGFVPLDEEEMFQLAKKYLPVLDPEFTKLVADEMNNPIAFIIASPDISRGIQKAKGRLFPFGFIHILRSARNSRQLDFFLGAVKDEYRNSGVTAMLGVSLFQSAMRRGLKEIDSHLILETNKPMRAVMERLGAKVYKRYRIYYKELG